MRVSSAEDAPRHPVGTHQSAEGPGEPSGDGRPDPEALLSAAGITEDEGASWLFKGPQQHTWWQPPKQEDASRKPADSVREENRGQLKPREARNQEEAHAEAGHALESVATPEQEDASRRPADAVREEDRGQLKPREAKNQEESRTEASHALESVATPEHVGFILFGD
ncbi:hypothetical protein NDU88_007420 [Pleurodeles waltl]|uniref:Uncharacterized protein n=1 Tax=Pleurodeles waltl TaxID=8319 RepID=A0AAV7SSV1_PLEWA|nr:hypothetical protein NDU88_007420 [Pleurodeles waltl]